MKKYLITGGAGFIGSHFIDYILQKYENILAVNLDRLTYAGSMDNIKTALGDKRHIFIRGDICDEKLVAGLFGQYDFDYVVNFAAETHVDRAIDDAHEFIRTNVMGAFHLINCAKMAWSGTMQNRKFVQISTDEVYGSREQGFCSEESPADPGNPYAASKAAADHIAMSYYKTYGLPVNITRSSNNYGPRQYPEKLIPLCIANCVKNEKIPVYGDGGNIRDWLYVRDHCRAIDLVLHSSYEGNIFNISAHNERDNLSVIKFIINYLNDSYASSIDEGLLSYVEDRPGHDTRYAMDTLKVESMLGFKPQMSFETGLKSTINWYVNNT